LTNEDNLSEEKTEVIHGAESTVNATSEQWSNLKHYADIRIDFYGPSMFVIPNHPWTFAYRKLIESGLRLSHFGNKHRRYQILQRIDENM